MNLTNLTLWSTLWIWTQTKTTHSVMWECPMLMHNVNYLLCHVGLCPMTYTLMITYFWTALTDLQVRWIVSAFTPAATTSSVPTHVTCTVGSTAALLHWQQLACTQNQNKLSIIIFCQTISQMSQVENNNDNMCMTCNVLPTCCQRVANMLRPKIHMSD